MSFNIEYNYYCYKPYNQWIILFIHYWILIRWLMNEESDLYFIKLNLFLHYIAHRIKWVEINRLYMDMDSYSSMNQLFLYVAYWTSETSFWNG